MGDVETVESYGVEHFIRIRHATVVAAVFGRKPGQFKANARNEFGETIRCP